MTGFTVRTPRELGASRIRLIGPNGLSVDDLNTPGDSSTFVREGEPGEYLAIVEPLGQPAQFVSFVFDGSSHELLLDVMSPSASTAIQSPSPIFPGKDADRAGAETFSVSARLKDSLKILSSDAQDPYFFLGSATPSRATAAASERQEAAWRADLDVERPRDDAHEAAVLRVGLSHDAEPFGPGGWRPADESLVELEDLDEGLRIRFRRKNEGLPPPAHARLRLSTSITGGSVQRMLIPLFAGGTTVTVARRLDAPLEVEISVAPDDPERLSLAQVLAAGVPDEGARILDGFTKGRALERYIREEKILDPWAGVLGALVFARFVSADPEQNLTWTRYLAERYGWITDVHVLAAQRLLSMTNSNDPDWTRRRRQALNALKRARRVGAPYFQYSNIIATDLLSALAGTPDKSRANEEDARFAYSVEVERSRWQRFLSWQGISGAFFLWRTRNRLAPGKGFDRRYVKTIREVPIENLRAN